MYRCLMCSHYLYIDLYLNKPLVQKSAIFMNIVVYSIALLRTSLILLILYFSYIHGCIDSYLKAGVNITSIMSICLYPD